MKSKINDNSLYNCLHNSILGKIPYQDNSLYIVKKMKSKVNHTYLIFVTNAVNAVRVKFLAECKKIPEEPEKYCFWQFCCKFTHFPSVKFSWLKMCACKKNDKCQVWRQVMGSDLGSILWSIMGLIMMPIMGSVSTCHGMSGIDQSSEILNGQSLTHWQCGPLNWSRVVLLAPAGPAASSSSWSLMSFLNLCFAKLSLSFCRSFQVC